ncbi:8-oxo-dGTP diphosphatase [Exiguobacterium sp. s80]|uniref:NUDIX hydrolase n=1 Tax=Exiguobacterium sp. s80 TaxID=2751209 RepID=UPI001BE8CC6C
MQDVPYPYTLCLVRQDDHFLLLNRQKQPAMGMWNGVGGKIEPGETPTAAVVRETFEETGIMLSQVQFAGTAVLRAEQAVGIYLYLADLPDGQTLPTPLVTREGILDWKSLNWILDPDNIGIISNLKHYLPNILNGPLCRHTFDYNQHQLTDYTTDVLPKDALQSIH